MRIPFLMPWKSRIPASKIYDPPVISLDLMPTAIAAAGGTMDEKRKWDGVDLLPYLTGKNPAKPHAGAVGPSGLFGRTTGSDVRQRNRDTASH